MFKIVFALVVVLFFLNGCSAKFDSVLFGKFKDNQEKFERIQNTSKVTIAQNGKIVGFITSFYEPNDKYEKFLVGVYSDDDLQKLQFRLDDKEALKVEELQNSDERLSQIPLNNKWSKYFEVTFLKSDSNIVKLQITNGENWDKEILFSKIPNYLNNKNGNIF